MNRKSILILVIAIVLGVNIFFGFPRLSEYSSVDEPYWTYDRTPDFWRAISERRWERTDINDKPGVTVAAISGLSLRWTDPMKYKSIRQEAKTLETSKDIKNTNFILRLPVYLTALAFLILFFILIKKFLGINIAILSLIFIGLSPILLGISLIINPDSLLWGFLPLSILSFLIYQKEASADPSKEQRKRKYFYLALSGFLMGLSLLTKYVANIGFVYVLGLIFLNYIFSSEKNSSIYTYLKKSVLDYVIFILIACFTFFVLYPACWEDPEVLLEGTLLSPAFKTTWPVFAGFFAFLLADALILKNKISSLTINFLAKYRKIIRILVGSLMSAGIIYVFINVFQDMKFFDFIAEMASPKGGENYTSLEFIQLVLTDLYGLLFALTPLVLIFFVWAIVSSAFKKETATKEENVVLYFSLFIFLYYIASTANHVTATIRYQIAMFPLAFIISAIGLDQFMSILKIKNFPRNLAVYALAIIISTISLFSISPHFFAYSSSLLPHEYVLNLKDMGDGSYEAAQYLNKLPNAQDLIIWSDKGAVCETFLGKCNVGFNKGDTYGFDFDYFVISTGRKSRSMKLHSAGYWKENIDFEKLYSSDDPGIYKITIGGRRDNFVKISKTEDLIKE